MSCSVTKRPFDQFFVRKFLTFIGALILGFTITGPAWAKLIEPSDPSNEPVNGIKATITLTSHDSLPIDGGERTELLVTMENVSSEPRIIYWGNWEELNYGRWWDSDWSDEARPTKPEEISGQFETYVKVYASDISIEELRTFWDDVTNVDDSDVDSGNEPSLYAYLKPGESRSKPISFEFSKIDARKMHACQVHLWIPRIVYGRVTLEDRAFIWTGGLISNRLGE